MAGRTDGLIKTFTASGAVPARSLVKFGAADNLVVVATAATDAIIGVSSAIDAADGEACDVHMSGIAEVRYGGAVTRGVSLLTAAAGGEAVAAAPAAGVNNRIIGVAMASGVDNDIAAVLLAPGQIQGA